MSERRFFGREEELSAHGGGARRGVYGSCNLRALRGYSHYFALLILALSAGSLAGCHSAGPQSPPDSAPVKCTDQKDCGKNERCGANNVCEPYAKCKTKECLNGQFCSEDKLCLTKDETCAKLKCDGVQTRGVCDPEQSTTKCVNASNCAEGGVDKNSLCLDGMVCNGGQCEKEECNSDGRCNNGRGMCDEHANPKCSDKPTCETTKDCLEGKYCVEGVKKCLKESDSSLTCRGHLTPSLTHKNVDERAVLECNEPSGGCHDAQDCKEGKRCVFSDSSSATGSCQDQPATCVDDAKGNHTVADAATYTRELSQDTLVLCGEEDWFSYDASHATTETLKVSVVVNKSDVGVKKVKLTLYKENPSDPSNPTEITSAESEEGKGRVALTHAIDSSSSDEKKTPGKYYVKVSSPDGESYTLDYNVYMELDKSTTATATAQHCGSSRMEAINFGSTKQSTQYNGNFHEFSPSCAPDNDANKRDYIYSFELAKRSNVTFEAFVNGNQEIREKTDLLLEIRKECDLATSVVECRNQSGQGKNEKLSKTLDAGKYYLIVSYASTEMAPFILNSERKELGCHRGETRCDKGNQKLYYCSDDETTMLSSSCSNCDDSSGSARCLDTEGDSCNSPIVLEAGTPYEKIIDIRKYSNSFVKESGCGNVRANHTTGNDLVFEVKDVPPNGLLLVSAQSTGFRSIYVVTECQESAQQRVCLKDQRSNEAAAKHKETLSWLNTTGTKQSVFVVVDTQAVAPGSLYADWITPTTMRLKAEILTENERECDPGAQQCHGGGRQLLRCNDYGKWEEGELCTNGCDQNTNKCIEKAANRCDTAPTVVSRGSTDGTYSIPNTSIVEEDTLLSKMTNVAASVSGCGNVAINRRYGGVDAFYKLETEPGKSYTVTVKTDGTEFVPFLWIGDGCNGDGSPSSCVDAKEPNYLVHSQTLTFTETRERTLYIGVEPYNPLLPSQKGAYTLTVDVATPSTETPYRVRKACAKDNGKDYAVYVDGNGNEKKIECPAGCTDGLCDSGSGDTCVDPIDLTAGRTKKSSEGTAISLDFSKNTAFMPELPVEVDNCHFAETGTVWSTSKVRPQGRDKFYSFVLNKDETLKITYKDTNTESNVAAFLQTEADKCGDPTICYNRMGRLSNDTLQYTATKNNQRVYLVLKTIDANIHKNTFSFEWEILDSISCTPNSSLCDGSSKVKLCNSDGQSYTDMKCLNGCSGGVCLPNSSFGASCDNPIEVEANGGVFYIGSDYPGGSFQLGHAYLGPTYQSYGKDAFFKVTSTQKNQIISVKAYSVGKDTPKIFMTTDCSKMNGYPRPEAKEAGSGTGFDHPTEMRVKATAANVDYYFLVDSSNHVYHKYVTFEIKEPECKDADYRSHCTAGVGSTGVISYCNEGSIETYTCANGCDTNQVLQCKNDSLSEGASCFNPIVLDLSSGGGTLDKQGHKTSQSTDPFTQLIDNGQELIDGCLFASHTSKAYSPKGTETYYAVDLVKHDRLDVRFTNIDPPGTFAKPDHFVAYITEGCAGKAKCLLFNGNSQDKGTPPGRSLSFTAPKTGRYHIVVDSIVSTSAIQWSITYKVTHKTDANYSCVPHFGYCDTDPMKPNTLHLCTSDGNIKDFECPEGCSGGFCLSTGANNTCLTATEIPESSAAAFSIPFASKMYTNNVNLPPRNGCFPLASTTRTSGSDAFYKISLKPYETLNVFIKRAFESEFSLAYLLERPKGMECVNPGFQCIPEASGKLSHASTDANQMFSYQNESDSTKEYTLVIDSDSIHEHHLVAAYIEIEGTDCEPTEKLGCDGNKMQYCLKKRIQKYECQGTRKCTTDSDGRSHCEEPAGDICQDAITIPLASSSPKIGSANGTFAGASNSYNFKSPNSCTHTEMPGLDRVYKVHLKAGETLTAKVISTETSTPEDVALYFSSDCGTLPNSCVGDPDTGDRFGATNKSGEEETRSYGPVAAEEDVYIIVDSWHQSLAGGFKLDVEVQ